TANVTSGGDGDYEYSLNGGGYGASNVFTGLNPGTHTIQVRDGNDCFASASVTIDPELSVVASAPNITACADETIVTISAAGGDGNYVYAVVPSGNTPTDDLFSATNPVSGIVVGNYNVYVRDHGGVADYCEAVFPLAIVKDPALEMDVTTLDNLCSGD